MCKWIDDMCICVVACVEVGMCVFVREIFERDVFVRCDVLYTSYPRFAASVTKSRGSDLCVTARPG